MRPYRRFFHGDIFNPFDAERAQFLAFSVDRVNARLGTKFNGDQTLVVRMQPFTGQHLIDRRLVLSSSNGKQINYQKLK